MCILYTQPQADKHLLVSHLSTSDHARAALAGGVRPALPPYCCLTLPEGMCRGHVLGS